MKVNLVGCVFAALMLPFFSAVAKAGLAAAPGAVMTAEHTISNLPARLYSPVPPPGAHAQKGTAVLLIGGSEGQLVMADDIGPQLASQGYPCLGVRYHDGWSGSRKLSTIPVEVFIDAVAWLKLQPNIKRVVVLGDSRGSEAAVLTALNSADVAGVVAYVPSAYVWSAVGNADPAGPSGWTLKGKPLEFVPPIKSDKSDASYYLKAVAAAAKIEAATLPIEKLRAPLLLLGADDDAVWPSGEMVRRIAARLAQKGFTFPVTARTYANAGHRLIGTGPSAPSETYKWGDQSFTSNYGGTAAGNLAARTAAWDELTSFLSKVEQPRLGP